MELSSKGSPELRAKWRTALEYSRDASRVAGAVAWLSEWNILTKDDAEQMRLLLSQRYVKVTFPSLAAVRDVMGDEFWVRRDRFDSIPSGTVARNTGPGGASVHNGLVIAVLLRRNPDVNRSGPPRHGDAL